MYVTLLLVVIYELMSPLVHTRQPHTCPNAGVVTRGSISSSL